MHLRINSHIHCQVFTVAKDFWDKSDIENERHFFVRGTVLYALFLHIIK